MASNDKISMPSPSELHAEHRKRMRKSFDSGNPESFHDHQLLELLIMEVIPRKDVNSQAHALLNEFGSLYGVFHADPKQTLRIPGVGVNTAQALQAAGVLMDYLESDENVPVSPRFKNSSELDVFCAQYAYISRSNILLLFMDKTLSLVYTHELNAESNLNRILWQSLSRNAAMVSICCHVDSIKNAQHIIDQLPELYQKIRLWQLSIMDMTIIEDVRESDTEKTVNLYHPLVSMHNLANPRLIELSLKQTQPRELTIEKFDI